MVLRCGKSCMVRVKVCGITRRTDAQLAARLGAWAIGLVFADSPRRVTRDGAREIIEHLDLHVLRVGVFVDWAEDRIVETVRHAGLDVVQLHGDESPDLCRRLKGQGIKVIKAIRVGGRESLEKIRLYEEACDFLLLDTFVEGKAGGTGKPFDWALAREAKSMTTRPMLLSGGIAPGNAKEALEGVSPFALDLSSGLEEAPGRKSPKLMKMLFDAICN